ncbi:PrsW family glutamic-type intramembrane protease [Anaeromyxobacter oryzisoli]|uniref:PrsW family glutamic-type intramembrane protease n=1 Tax=Anaeromyxobacter oryzisoli TaxID=2925408 RepID=UPI001F59C6C4|nr:PrsW family glutamic-type intramembrane protease [Anaeromyxobacter sp. SG63]
MRYYYAAGGALRGPSTLERLAGLLAQGLLPGTTAVWGEDGTGPTPLGELVAAPLPPPLPPPGPAEAAPLPAAAPGRPGAPPRREPERTVGALLAEYFSPREMLPLLASPRFWVLYALAATPIVILALGADDPTSWLFFYFSLVWAVLFHRLVQPERRTGILAVLVYLASIVFTIPALLAYLSTPPFVTDALVASRSALARLVGFVLGVGVREEVFKILPLLALARWRGALGARLTLRQGVFLGALAGLGFAATENLAYLAQFEAHDRLAYRLGVFSQESLEGTLTRLLLTPFMHGAWAGISGYFVAWAEWHPRRRWTFRLAGLAGVAALHGLYDFFADAPALALVVIAFTLHVLVRCMARAANEASGVEHLEHQLG